MTVSLEDLKNSMCKWPFGDPRDDDFHFCGEKAESEGSYCKFHRLKAYREYTRSRDKNKTKKAA